jgi:hypothetical protein
MAIDREGSPQRHILFFLFDGLAKRGRAFSFDYSPAFFFFFF